MSIHTYTRNRAADGWDLEMNSLAKSTEAALPGKQFKVGADDTVVTFSFVDTLTAGEVVTLDGVVAANRAGGPYSPRGATPAALTLNSPDGSTFSIQVSNAGALSTTKVS